LTRRKAEKHLRKLFVSPRGIKFTKEKTVETSEMVLATPHRVWGSLERLARELKNIGKPLLQPRGVILYLHLLLSRPCIS